MHSVTPAGEVIRRIVERTDLDEFTEGVLASFWDRPEFRRLAPPREEVRAWVRWNIDLLIRWLVAGEPPTESELEDFRARARARAAEGVPADIVPANFRRGARYAWGALIEAADERDRPALLESADLLFEYVDRVSEIFSETYAEAAGTVPASAEERSAQGLIARLTNDGPLLGEDHLLGERIGFAIRAAYHPFAIASPRRSARDHAALAAELRASHLLAACEGRLVTGLAVEPIRPAALDLGRHAVIVVGELSARGELAEAFEDLRAVLAIAGQRGRSGTVTVREYLPELLLSRSPSLAARIETRVYGPLQQNGSELARTLDLLIEHDFDRGATALALPVHRNTLNNRLRRVRELTGVDVDTSRGRALAWLAWQQRASAGPR